MAIEVLGVEHIDLTVNDVARSRAFFDKVLGELGFRKSERTDYIFWANAQMTIAIRETSAAIATPASTATASDYIISRCERARAPTSMRSTTFSCAKGSRCSTLPPSIRSMEKITTRFFSPIPSG